MLFWYLTMLFICIFCKTRGDATSLILSGFKSCWYMFFSFSWNSKVRSICLGVLLCLAPSLLFSLEPRIQFIWNIDSYTFPRGVATFFIFTLSFNYKLSPDSMPNFCIWLLDPRWYELLKLICWKVSFLTFAGEMFKGIDGWSEDAAAIGAYAPVGT